MKKLFVLLTIIASSTTFATFKYDPMTDRFYSENAPKNVDQDEYHEIICVIKSEWTQGIFNLTNHQLAQIFAFLRARGTPAALQVIHDIEEAVEIYREEVIKMGRKDINRLIKGL